MIVSSLVGFAVLSSMIRLVCSSMFDSIIDSTSSVVKIGFIVSLVRLLRCFSAFVEGLSFVGGFAASLGGLVLSFSGSGLYW